MPFYSFLRLPQRGVGVALLLVLSLLTAARSQEPSRFCMPMDGTDCWPTDLDWQTFSDALDGELIVYADSTEGGGDVASSYEECLSAGMTGTEVLEVSGNSSGSATGLCQMYHDCRFSFCDARLDDDENVNLPAAVVLAQTVADVQASLAFAVKHHLPVTIKSSGHSYSGSSTGKDSLMIWTRTLETNGVEVMEDYTTSCPDSPIYPTVAKIGGGDNWGEVYAAVGNEYNIVGGFGKTVSAAGGWLQGGGLSSMARKFGYGVDNVVDIDIVLVNGTYVTVNECTHPDLFWALRGGGGGTFGVVTAVRTQLHPLEQVTQVLISFDFSDFAAVSPALDSWAELWVNESPYLPKEWGGYWSTRFALLYYTGAPSGAQPFILNLLAWRNNLTTPDLVTVFPQTTDGYYGAWQAGFIPNDQPAGNAEYFMVSRMISREEVVADPAGMLAKITTQANGFAMGGYFLGGAAAEVDKNATAIGPHAREAIWQINLQAFSREQHDAISATLSANFPTAGSGYNHGSKDQANWTTAFWGDANYERLLTVKRQYDPTSVLNCWHCVGYQGVHADGTVTNDVARPEEPTIIAESTSESPSSAPTAGSEEDTTVPPTAAPSEEPDDDGDSAAAHSNKWVPSCQHAALVMIVEMFLMVVLFG